ncbi:MAG: hypothetical protein V1674_02280 [Candidatus Omnitrophota bacterium]
MKIRLGDSKGQEGLARASKGVFNKNNRKDFLRFSRSAFYNEAGSRYSGRRCEYLKADFVV